MQQTKITVEVIHTQSLLTNSKLIELFKLRKIIFRDRMNWKVDVTEDGLEIDDFDSPNCIYLLAYLNGSLVGTWRFLPTTSSIMIKKVWPQFLNSISIPESDKIWEASRFGVFVDDNNKSAQGSVESVTATMFMALTDVCMRLGVKKIYTLYDVRIARLLRGLHCFPVEISEPIKIDGIKCWVGKFNIDDQLLQNLKKNSVSLSHEVEIPPALLAKQLEQLPEEN